MWFLEPVQWGMTARGWQYGLPGDSTGVGLPGTSSASTSQSPVPQVDSLRGRLQWRALLAALNLGRDLDVLQELEESIEHYRREWI